ncbi:MAG: lytic murein transglycosylase, partial [Coxiellaceae bacterium]|nr:lytic murein transglycosylase [Coxiellaceae bacterium]
MLRKTLYLIILIGTLSFSLVAKAEDKPKTETIPPRATKAINAYVDELVQKYKFNKTNLTKIMAQASYDPKVIHWITHPFEKKPWNFYRSFFVRQDRIDNGVKYWLQHKKLFNKIQKEYGVDPSVIIAIIGIESFFGEHAGTYNELNALTTLSFYYPKRSKFFRSELTEFLRLTRHEKLNPLLLKGSYAGALGIPQFMPSSYRNYGV